MKSFIQTKIETIVDITQTYVTGQTEIDDEYDPYHTTLLVDMSLFQK